MARQGERDEGHQRFWDLAEPYLASGALVEGTMMGHQCLRTAGSNGFVATIERSTGNLVVKLPKARVTELVDAGEGAAFSPAGKVFKEWVELPAFDERRWTALLEESIDFVDG
jgi:hypothetical protein